MSDKIKLPSTSVIIAAGGKAIRMGRPKQMIALAGKPVLFYCMETFLKIPQIREIIVVTGRKEQNACKANFKSKKIKYAASGDTRLQSVKEGLGKVSKTSKLVAVHDGARPLISKKIILACLLSAHKTGTGIAAVPANDTVKTSLNGKTVTKTLNRNILWNAQTPQCYKTEILKKALKKFPRKTDATDESQLVEKTGVKISLVKSDNKNIKITVPEDLTAAEAYVNADGKKALPNVNLRIGLGYDIHRTTSGRPFIIGGVKIPHDKGLLGHSDGDVVVHSVCDAVLGSVASGEIGMFFPPTDLTIMGISSTVIADKTLEILKSKKASLVQIDVTVIAEEPKILPYYQVIRQSISKIFKISVADISFKAKSQEGVGAIGKGNAVACHALVMVRYL